MTRRGWCPPLFARHAGAAVPSVGDPPPVRLAAEGAAEGTPSGDGEYTLDDVEMVGRVFRQALGGEPPEE